MIVGITKTKVRLNKSQLKILKSRFPKQTNVRAFKSKIYRVKKILIKLYIDVNHQEFTESKIYKPLTIITLITPLVISLNTRISD